MSDDIHLSERDRKRTGAAALRDGYSLTPEQRRALLSEQVMIATGRKVNDTTGKVELDDTVSKRDQTRAFNAIVVAESRAANERLQEEELELKRQVVEGRLDPGDTSLPQGVVLIESPCRSIDEWEKQRDLNQKADGK